MWDLSGYPRLAPDQASVYAEWERLARRLGDCVNQPLRAINQQDLQSRIDAWGEALGCNDEADTAWRALWACWRETSGTAEHYARQLLASAGSSRDGGDNLVLRWCVEGHAQWSLVRQAIVGFLDAWLVASRPAGQRRRRRRDYTERLSLGTQAAVMLRDGVTLSAAARRLGVNPRTLRDMPGVEEAQRLVEQGRQDERERRTAD